MDCFIFLVCGADFELLHDRRRRSWVSEQKGLSILFAKRYPTKQEVFRAEQAQARENDYATGEGNEKSRPRNH